VCVDCHTEQSPVVCQGKQAMVNGTDKSDKTDKTELDKWPCVHGRVEKTE